MFVSVFRCGSIHAAITVFPVFDLLPELLADPARVGGGFHLGGPVMSGGGAKLTNKIKEIQANVWYQYGYFLPCLPPPSCIVCFCKQRNWELENTMIPLFQKII